MNSLNKSTLGRYRGIKSRKLTPAQLEKLEQERRAYKACRTAECFVDAIMAGFAPAGDSRRNHSDS